jgi:hypothetical protein
MSGTSSVSAADSLNGGGVLSTSCEVDVAQRRHPFGNMAEVHRRRGFNALLLLQVSNFVLKLQKLHVFK